MSDHVAEAYLVPVVAALPPGETVEAVVAVVSADPGTVEQVSARDELLNLLDPAAWVGLGTHPGETLRRLAFGRAVTGGPGSTAVWLHEEIGRARSPVLVVTGDGVLVGSMASIPIPSRGVAGQFEPGGRRPRAQFTGAAARPRGILRRGRVVVECADGSSVAVVARRQHAAALVAALAARPPGSRAQGGGA